MRRGDLHSERDRGWAEQSREDVIPLSQGPAGWGPRGSVSPKTPAKHTLIGPLPQPENTTATSMSVK